MPTDEHARRTLHCGICGESIRTGQKRQSSTFGTIHTDCDIPKSPLPQFNGRSHPDWIEVETKNHSFAGHIAGSAVVAEPEKGHTLTVEAEEWPDSPTDRLRVIHRYHRGAWQDVFAYVEEVDVDDETGEWNSSWRNIGKVRDMEIEDAE